MACQITFLIVRRLLELLRLGPTPDEKDVEVAMLRHQLAVLRHQLARPRYSPADRAFLATLARLLSRERWAASLVTPATLRRWHRELIARSWAYPRRGQVAVNAIDDEVVALVLRLARENARWVKGAKSRSMPALGATESLGEADVAVGLARRQTRPVLSRSDKGHVGRRRARFHVGTSGTGTRCPCYFPGPKGYAATGRYSWMSPPSTSWRSTSKPARRFGGRPARGHAEVEATMRPLLVVVAEVLPEDRFEVAPPEHQGPVEALNAGRPHEPFGQSVRPGRAHRSLDDFGTFRPEHLVESWR